MKIISVQNLPCWDILIKADQLNQLKDSSWGSAYDVICGSLLRKCNKLTFLKDIITYLANCFSIDCSNNSHFYFLASSAKMGLVETKLAIIPGAGMKF